MAAFLPSTPANIERPAVVAVASGKGGVGKTHVSVNLSLALGRLDKRVLLFDGDLGLANAGAVMGVRPRASLEAVLERRAKLADVVEDAAANVGLVAGGSGVAALADLGEEGRAQLCSAFTPLVTDLDYLVVDTAAGIGRGVTDLVAGADIALIVLCEEPAAFMDAYATVKRLHLDHGCRRFLVVPNMVADEAMGRLLFERFAGVARRFLDAELDYLGSVPRDPRIRDAALVKRPVVDAFPDSRAGVAFTTLARSLDAHVARHPVSGRNAFFRTGDLNACAA